MINNLAGEFFGTNKKPARICAGLFFSCDDVFGLPLATVYLRSTRGLATLTFNSCSASE
jgi:hypothetical protein